MSTLAVITALGRQIPRKDITQTAPKAQTEKEAALTRIQEAMRQGKAAADSVISSVNSERRSRARAAVKRLEEQIAKLATLVAISPKAMARMIRQLEHQLADAVSDYAKSGGEKGAAETSTFKMPDPDRPETMTPEAERDRVLSSYRAVSDSLSRSEHDRDFVRKAGNLHQRMKDMMEFALHGIEDEKEREDNARAFAKNSETVEKGLSAIEEWMLEPPAPVLVPGSAGFEV